MAPGIALEALANANGRLRVLDPMMGSGTVLAVARSKGHEALGFDLDPLAVLLTKVWTTTIDPQSVLTAAERVLSRAKKTFSNLAVGSAYPTGSDDETKEFIRYWFDEHARRQLTSLARAIASVRNSTTRDVLWCGFSRLIITKSMGASLAMDLAHSRPHKTHKRAPVKPFDRFMLAVNVVVSNCPQVGSEQLGPVAITRRGDARELKVRAASVDLVLTSPPYLNAIDYMRCSKFSLVWMGHKVEKIRAIRRESVGAEAGGATASADLSVAMVIKKLRLTPALSDRGTAILCQYVSDIDRSVAEVSRVLKAHGRAIYVVGDSTVRGTFIRNSSIVVAAARRHGMQLISRHSRKLPENRRYLPPPRGGDSGSLNARMRREVVLVFSKMSVSNGLVKGRR